MYKIFKMALKNVLRNKRRTIITVLMISFGIIVTMFISGFLGAISQDLEDSVILSQTGDIQIMAVGFKDKMMSGSLEYTINNVSSLIVELAQEPEIVAVTRRVVVNGLISTGKQSVFCWGTAVDLDTVDKTLPDLFKSTDSRYVTLEGVDGVVLGESLAKKLDVEKGASLMLVSYDKYGGMNATNLTVTDFIKCATAVEEDSKIIMTVNNATTLYGLEDEVTDLCIKVKDRAMVSDLVYKFAEKYGEKYNIEFFAWEDLMGSYAQTIGMFKGVQFFLLLIMSIVVMIGVVNSVLMCVFERTSEIGTLRAIGSSKGRIISLFMVESLWIGILGGIIGVILGTIIIALTSIKGIPFYAPGTTQAFYIKPILEPGMVITPPLVLMIVSMLAGIYPARFAAKMNPIDAIRKN